MDFKKLEKELEALWYRVLAEEIKTADEEKEATKAEIRAWTSRAKKKFASAVNALRKKTIQEFSR